MRCAILSGITGHLGQELAQQLASAGIEVHGLTRQNITSTPRSGQAIQLHRVNGSTETLVALFQRVKPDIVFHLAALARREHQGADIAPFVETNILLGTQLLEGARVSGCTRFITAGSYLQHEETGEYRAFNLYAATKQAFEDLLAYYVGAFSFSALILTLCNIYSEKDKRPTLLMDIATACTLGTPLRLHAGTAYIDPVHVEDVARAFVRAAQLLEEQAIPVGTMERYSVSSRDAVTSEQLIGLFERLTQQKLVVDRGALSQCPRRSKPWCGETVPGWAPKIGLEVGLARILRSITSPTS